MAPALDHPLILFIKCMLLPCIARNAANDRSVFPFLMIVIGSLEPSAAAAITAVNPARWSAPYAQLFVYLLVVSQM